MTDDGAEIHHRHRDVTGGWLRPAVFGAMDGLVSNVALIAGVAGGGASARTVTLAGLAGLVGGAFSMATGEYTSVAAQSELTRAEIAVEKAEIKARPLAEMHELAGLYRSRGVESDLAERVAEQLSRDPEQAWRIHAREELGVDPDDLPSPWTAAGSSFAAFTIGALIPLLPYLVGASSLLSTALLAALGLFGFGALTARFTRRGWAYSGLRQLLLGVAAAAVTYGVGSAVGAGLG
ncbi:MAG: Nodulin-related protein SCO_2027 [uncultured Corynebacteriales bacterium]|uniref:Nodulin-related protein SCO_2027 n=1 Tax=uncultured Mycobacteriales bacterium TaxID=581187 RepID=A0A6J4K2C1_9ACTN|nr:MAG: Nodulin-related protein SCO_2027 [uncultured Corynebacteriales bacterium]